LGSIGKMDLKMGRIERNKDQQGVTRKKGQKSGKSKLTSHLGESITVHNDEGSRALEGCFFSGEEPKREKSAGTPKLQRS